MAPSQSCLKKSMRYLLRTHADIREVRRRVLGDFSAIELDFSGCHRDVRSDNIERGRFSCAIRTKQAKYLSLFNSERRSFDRLEAIWIGFVDSLRLRIIFSSFSRETQAEQYPRRRKKQRYMGYFYRINVKHISDSLCFSKHSFVYVSRYWIRGLLVILSLWLQRMDELLNQKSRTEEHDSLCSHDHAVCFPWINHLALSNVRSRQSILFSPIDILQCCVCSRKYFSLWNMKPVNGYCYLFPMR